MFVRGLTAILLVGGLPGEGGTVLVMPALYKCYVFKTFRHCLLLVWTCVLVRLLGWNCLWFISNFFSMLSQNVFRFTRLYKIIRLFQIKSSCAVLSARYRGTCNLCVCGWGVTQRQGVYKIYSCDSRVWKNGGMILTAENTKHSDRSMF
jgi:hypothetical protein